MAAALKESGIVRLRLRKQRSPIRHSNVFRGSDAVDWILSEQIASKREEAIHHCELLIIGNLIRSVPGGDITFRDSKNCIYRFVADDKPHKGPSVASIISTAVLEGWLQVVFGHSIRQSFKKTRYCMLPSYHYNIYNHNMPPLYIYI